MKELSIEEKAKAYDEVREKIAIRFGSNIADEIFSQFEMSEDEKIRKALIHYFTTSYNIAFIGDKKITNKDVIAWLEKQGEPPAYNQFTLEQASILDKHIDKFLEQKPADKVEPKFKVGDKINMINREEEDYTILTITSINMDEKCYICNQGSVIDFDEEREWYKIEQKPAWSEEDENMIQALIACINAAIKGGMNYITFDSKSILIEKVKNWLKFLKDRYN